MIIREYLLTRKDGVALYKTYSSRNKMIRKIGTDEMYAEAIDVSNAPYSYEETAEDIPKPEDNI